MGSLLIICGPSGSGKTTVEKELEKCGTAIPLKSHTTRKPRGDEDTYHFVSPEEFIKLEFAENVVFDPGNEKRSVEDVISSMQSKGITLAEALGSTANFYGLSVAEINRADADPDHDYVVVVEAEGVKQIRKIVKSPCVTVLLDAPKEELEARLTERGNSDRIGGLEAHRKSCTSVADLVLFNRDGRLKETVSTLRFILAGFGGGHKNGGDSQSTL